MNFLKRILFGRKGKAKARKATKPKPKPKFKPAAAIVRCKTMPRPIRRNLWRTLKATQGISWKQFLALEQASK